MAISLQKGGNVNLSKEAPGLSSLKLGLGWDVRATDGAAFDLDGVAFLLNQSGKVRSDADFIFYNNAKSADGSVTHSGDNRTGAGEGMPPKATSQGSGAGLSRTEPEGVCPRRRRSDSYASAPPPASARPSPA